MTNKASFNYNIFTVYIN